MNWNNFILPIMRHFRRKRVKCFIHSFPDLPNLTVLDVGGRPFIWELIKQEYGLSPKRVVLLNYAIEVDNLAGYESVVGDGTCMIYPEKSFDLVFSNSVIEHVGDIEKMRKFASECERVGKDIYIQSPNRWFPIEPHLVTCFIHWLPRIVYRPLSFLSLRYFSLRNHKHLFYEIFDGINLLSKNELAQLFPGRRITSESFLGFAKSFIVSSR